MRTNSSHRRQLLAIGTGESVSQNSKLVNLDAMISRADFYYQGDTKQSYDPVSSIGVRDLSSDSMWHTLLRKPDFQRETNQWTPNQVVSLLKCFVDGDLIPSVILWRSPSHIYVIDGGHRLSALKAWIEDDYGDGAISQKFFGRAISSQQIQAARETRKQVEAQFGPWDRIQKSSKIGNVSPDDMKRYMTITTRGLAIQWVQGNAEKAESSFFQINTRGTPLDEIEQRLLKNRKKPIAIACRAVIRAGQGHKYWSDFAQEHQTNIETLSKQLHHTILEPEIKTPIKTLDLPIGGAKGFRTVLELLMQFLLFAIQDHNGIPADVEKQPEDFTGDQTAHVLKRALSLAGWITGNEKGSLGLHPAIYFYGPGGRHVSSLFLGTAHLFSRKIANNDKRFFIKFSSVREKLETVLIQNKDMMSTIIGKIGNARRITNHSSLLDQTIDKLADGHDVTAQDLIKFSKLYGKIIVGGEEQVGREFNEETKSTAFIKKALIDTIKCPICNGYLDPTKSISYDHTKEKSLGGNGDIDNLQLTHPYCNQTYKNYKNEQDVNKLPNVNSSMDDTHETIPSEET